MERTPSTQHMQLLDKETQVKQSVRRVWGLPTKLTTFVIPGPKNYAPTIVSWCRVRQRYPGIYRTCRTKVVYCFTLWFGVRHTFRNQCFQTQRRQRLHASWIFIGLCLYDPQSRRLVWSWFSCQYTTCCETLQCNFALGNVDAPIHSNFQGPYSGVIFWGVILTLKRSLKNSFSGVKLTPDIEELK